MTAVNGAVEPTEYNSLDDILAEGVSSERPISVQVCHNMGARTFLFSMPMKEFYDQSIVANEIGPNEEPVAQRKLDPKHAAELSKYLLKGLIRAAILKRSVSNQSESGKLSELEEYMGKRPYVSIQPLVCNIRGIASGGSSLRAERMIDKATGTTSGIRVYLAQNHLLHVVDGQHRRKAMQMLFEFLQDAVQTRKLSRQPAKNLLLPDISGDIDEQLIVALQECLEVASSLCTVQIEAHLGLTISEERQLFHDLNNLSKKVDANLVLQFDSANPVNAFIKESLLDDETIFNWEVIEKDSPEWNEESDCSITRKELTSINARLFLNKTSINGALASKVTPMTETALNFWSAVNNIEHIGRAGAKVKSVATQPVFLKALAKLAYMFTNGKKADSELLNQMLLALPEANFTHKNPLWRYFNLTQEERTVFKLDDVTEHLPEDIENKASIKMFSVWDSGKEIVKYGTAHNDIHPILGDLIRYELKLPTREHRK